MANITSMSGFIHPFDFNKNHLIGRMTERGIVDVNGSKYRIKPHTFFTVEPIHLFLQQDKYETESTYQARLHNEQLEKEQDKEQEILRQKQLQQRAVAEQIQKEKARQDFHAAYDIPVKYSVRIKPVLSGLSEHSMGNGAYKNTVFHLFLEEELTGRLKRQPHTFLCTPSNDGKWFAFDSYVSDEPVTCKKCLTLMERWHNRSFRSK